MPRDDYEERQAEKRDRFEELAAKRKKEANDLWNSARKSASVIPMGQPILVGHHSEKSHRAHLKRINNMDDRAMEANDKSKYYEGKVKSMDLNRAISQDDPEAVQKIKEKIESLKLKAAQAKKDRKEMRDRKEELEKKDGYWQLYYLKESHMSNARAEIKRLEERLKSLASLDAVEEVQFEKDGISFEVNKSENRVMIFFPGKPSEEVRSKLKRHGFRWSPRNMAWQAYIKQWNIDFAKEIVQG